MGTTEGLKGKMMRLLHLNGRGLNDTVLVNADQICVMTHDYVKTESNGDRDRFADHGVVRQHYTRLSMPSGNVDVAESPEHVALLMRGWNPDDERLSWLGRVEAEGGPTYAESRTLSHPDTADEAIDGILTAVAERCERWCETASDAARATAAARD